MGSLEDRISKTSLEDRITKPEDAEEASRPSPETSATEPTDEVSKPSVKTDAAPAKDDSKIESWADEMATPVQPTAPADTDDLQKAQVDGSSENQNGSAGTFEPTYDVEVKLSDVQADPNNPLFSTTSFEDQALGLSEDILKGVRQMRFLKPSKIQEKALPLLLKDPPQNLIGQSQSGTGKTAAFVLNILKRLNVSLQAPQALVLSPTRELTRQIQGVIQVMGMFMAGLTVAAAIPMDAANRGKKVDAQVVVGTPGTTMDMIRRRLIDISNIKVVVLDEADNMLDLQGLGDQCIRIKKMLRPAIQIVLFSATFEDRVVDYATMFAPNANQITLKHEELTVEGIKQMYIDCANDEVKFDTLVRLYGVMTIGSSIIFVKTRDTAKKLTQRLSDDGHQVAALTGEYEGSQRDVIIDAFRTGQAKVLITTNVLARGIDVQTVSLVINYDIPQDANHRPDPATYLHRIGRTGRFGRVGVSISLVSPGRPWKDLQDIANYYRISLIQLDTDDWDDVEEQIKRVIKSSRAGSNFQGNTKNDMAG